MWHDYLEYDTSTIVFRSKILSRHYDYTLKLITIVVKFQGKSSLGMPSNILISF